MRRSVRACAYTDQCAVPSLSGRGDSDSARCVARPTGLTDEPATGRAKAVARVVGRAAIPRADVAAWMLDALEAPRFEARTPMLTVTGAP